MSVSSDSGTSSCDSSELDDIQLAEPSRRIYESTLETQPAALPATTGDGERPSTRSLIPPPTNRAHGPGRSSPDDAPLRIPDLSRTRDNAEPSLPAQAPSTAASGRTAAAGTRLPPPMLRLPSDVASRSPMAQVASTPGSVTPMKAAQQSGRIAVDLLSSAFVFDDRTWRQAAERGLSPSDVVVTRTCSGLGIDVSDLRFFELRAVGVEDLRPDGAYAVRVERSGDESFKSACLAVAHESTRWLAGCGSRSVSGWWAAAWAEPREDGVLASLMLLLRFQTCQRTSKLELRHSGFTLKALEELIKENHNLKATQDQNASSIEALQSLLRKCDEERSQLFLHAAEQQAEAKRYQERCRISEGHVKLLRQQLSRSDELRADGQQQLNNLKQEFLELTRLLPKRAQTSSRRPNPYNSTSTSGIEAHKPPNDLPHHTNDAFDSAAGSSTWRPLLPASGWVDTSHAERDLAHVRISPAGE